MVRVAVDAIEFDDAFASSAATAVIFAVVLLAWPAWWAAGRFIADDAPNLGSVVAMLLLLAGILTIAGGVYLALLELRGRAKPKDSASRSMVRGFNLSGSEAKEIVSEFGKLRSTHALLLTALALFAGAFGLAWRSTAPASAPTTTTTTSVAGSAASASSSSTTTTGSAAAPTGADDTTPSTVSTGGAGG